MSEKLFWKMFSKRTTICFFIIISLFLSCVLRVAVINTKNYREVQQNQSSLKIKISDIRGTVFDKNLIPITNSEKKIIACVSPTPRAVTAISNVLKGKELEDVLERLKKGKPITCEVDEFIECDGIICTEIYTHNSSDTPAIHTVGYTDSENKGVTGLEKAYNDILYSEESVTISYACDGLGQILAGIPPTLENNDTAIANGVVSTIDINIQNILEECSQELTMGAVIVSEVKNSKIRGIVSIPDFDSTAINEYIEKEYSPLFNRTIAAYNVGSAFKPCIAAAAIENGFESYTHNCTGSFEIGDRVFRCHKTSGHGITNLNTGLMNSCNTFFYNLSFAVGNNEIYKTAKTLNFGEGIKLCENIYTSKGTMPKKSTLENMGQLANFSIGQGELTATPISMLTLYNSVANGGKYYLPSVTEGVLQNGNFKEYKIGSPTVAFSESTANRIKGYLKSVVEEGTGKLAKPTLTDAAGKTSTAQTGKFENSNEICSTWFCGFFPFDNPKYSVIIFCEDSSKQTKSCSEIFSIIADKITILEQ